MLTVDELHSIINSCDRLNISLFDGGGFQANAWGWHIEEGEDQRSTYGEEFEKPHEGLVVSGRTVLPERLRKQRFRKGADIYFKQGQRIAVALAADIATTGRRQWLVFESVGRIYTQEDLA